MAALMQEMRVQRVRPGTVGAYPRWVALYLKGLRTPLEKATRDDVKQFVARLPAKHSPSTITQALAAVRFLYVDALGLPDPTAGVKRPKKRTHLPKYLTREEVRALLKALDGPFLVAAMLMYYLGLRLSEALNLKAGDLEQNLQSGWVRQGKGGKDRRFQVPKPLTGVLRGAIQGKKPQQYVVLLGKERPSPSTIQKEMARAGLDAGIVKAVHPHLLRHSFATHLHEDGVDIRDIQELLGHANIGTTQVYAAVTGVSLKKVRGVLDRLG